MAEATERVPRLAPPIEVAIQTDILDALEELIELVKAQIPRGIVFPWEEEITKRTELDFRPNPLFSVQLVNKGPDKVYVRIYVAEEPSVEIPVDPDETIGFDFKVAKIERMEFRVDVGKRATVKVVGLC